MSTPPRWHDRNNVIIPIESVSGMTRMRLEESKLFAAEAEKEAEAARSAAAKLTAIADEAAEQREYWERVAEIAQEVDDRLDSEGGVAVVKDSEEVGTAVATLIVNAAAQVEAPF